MLDEERGREEEVDGLMTEGRVDKSGRSRRRKGISNMKGEESGKEVKRIERKEKADGEIGETKKRQEGEERSKEG